MFSFDFPIWMFCLAQVTLIGGIVLIASRILIRRSPDVASLVSALALVAGCLLVVSTGMDVPRPWTIHSPDETLVADASHLPAASQGNPKAQTAEGSSLLQLGLVPAELFAQLKPLLNDPATPQHRLGKITFHFAILCCALLVIRLSVGVLALIALRWGSRPLVSDTLHQQLECFQSRLTLKKRIRIRVCSGRESPRVCWLSPTIIFVPQGFEDWSTAEQSSCLSLIHI